MAHTDDLARELIALEREGWDALVAGRGADHYREHLAPDAVMAFPFGVLDRDQALAAMESAPPWARYEIRDPQVVALGPDAGVLVYSVDAQRDGDPPFRGILSSTFVRRDGAWRLAVHQQSPA